MDAEADAANPRTSPGGRIHTEDASSSRNEDAFLVRVHAEAGKQAGGEG
ncbi:hypothetical protein [Pseudoclavibacter sp. RFBA6]|nr:hypothetical protein [Pseudoclavibacter sp. RFBA6]